MRFADVGSSLGYYALLAAKRVGNEGHVVAFEPDPFRFRCLLENIRMNKRKNVKAYNLTISDTNSPDQKIATLDRVLENIDFVKIDVEGGELEVLRGMKKFLAKGIRIICELHPVQLSSRGHTVEEVSDLLKHYGYGFYLIDERGLSPHLIYLMTKLDIFISQDRGSRRFTSLESMGWLWGAQK